MENVEFYHTGQEGYTEPYDPRYSLAFVDTLSDNTTNFYSYVRNNAFHNGFSPAVGVFAVDNLEVSGNVIHHTVYHGQCCAHPMLSITSLPQKEITGYT